MILTNKIRGMMAEKNITGEQLAKALNIAPKTFYDKMKKGVFGTNEAEIMIKILDIKEPCEIFFAKQTT